MLIFWNPKLDLTSFRRYRAWLLIVPSYVQYVCNICTWVTLSVLSCCKTLLRRETVRWKTFLVNQLYHFPLRIRKIRTNFTQCCVRCAFLLLTNVTVHFMQRLSEREWSLGIRMVSLHSSLIVMSLLLYQFNVFTKKFVKGSFTYYKHLIIIPFFTVLSCNSIFVACKTLLSCNTTFMCERNLK